MNLRRLITAIIPLCISGLLIRIGARAVTSGLDQWMSTAWLYLPIVVGAIFAACTLVAYVSRKSVAWVVAAITAAGYFLPHVVHFSAGAQSGFGLAAAGVLSATAVICIRSLTGPAEA